MIELMKIIVGVGTGFIIAVAILWTAIFKYALAKYDECNQDKESEDENSSGCSER